MKINRENVIKQISRKFKKITLFLAGIAVLMTASMASADDTEIYFPSTVTTEPNILFVISNNATMSDGMNGNPFDSTWCNLAAGGCNANLSWSATNQYYNTVYPISSTACQGGNCAPYTIYSLNAQTQKWTSTNLTLAGICTTAANSLETTGMYVGYYQSKTGGVCDTHGSTDNLATGNYIDWANSGNSGGTSTKIAITQSVLNSVVSSAFGARFGVIGYGAGNSAGTFSTGTVSGSNYTAYVNDMDAYFIASSLTNRYALTTTISQITINSNNTQAPMAESLWEAEQYFKGGPSAFIANKTYTSPILASCQKNVVIFIADGISTSDNFSGTKNNASFLQSGICNGAGDCDGDGFEPNHWNYGNNGTHYLDDVAKYMADNKVTPLNGPVSGTQSQNIITYTIGLGGNYTTCPAATDTTSSATDLLCRTADATHGRGGYIYAGDSGTLSEAIRQIVVNVLITNSSFVAPVVPVSPDNKTSSGNYVYMGFFKPQTDAFWFGNLKKFQIDNSGAIYDANGVIATYVDSVTGFTYFKSTALSFWSVSADGGSVDAGGAGALLQARASNTRNLYTYIPGTSTTTSLTDPTNAFTTTNGALTPAVLNVATTAAAYSVIQYIHGYDVYGSTPTARRVWIMGDILHSRPSIVQYATYTTTTSSPTGIGSIGDCGLNKTIIYVGSNDGMLHAFKDCDGSELWGFIPPDQLPKLNNIATGSITPPSRSFYYVDGSPRTYILDANGDGQITTGASGDKAIVIFGERRGGSDYYALDVTDPANPVFLWQLNIAAMQTFYNGATSGNGCVYGTSFHQHECGALSFSDPVIGKVLINVSGTPTSKAVFFIGGGYDPLEDCRTTNTWVVSCSTDSYSADKAGRGVFAFDVLTGAYVWEQTFNFNAKSASNTVTPVYYAYAYSIPSQVTVFDSNGDGYLDTLYVGNVGGFMIHVDISNVDPANWNAESIFASQDPWVSNPDQGRKIFYPPDVTIQPGSPNFNMLFFGTGDREHPKSSGFVTSTGAVATVIDRLYAVQDRAAVNSPATNPPRNLITEVVNTTPMTTYSMADATAGSVTLGSNDYGWYIKLNTNFGEKVLSATAVFNKVAFYTTYVPLLSSTDPCQVELGSAYVWAVNYLTSAAAINANRSWQVGTGIPSGIVIAMGQTGSYALIGVGGAVTTTPTNGGGRVFPLYWHEVR